MNAGWLVNNRFVWNVKKTSNIFVKNIYEQSTNRFDKVQELFYNLLKLF